MKPIQVTFDETLLARLDRHPMVRERGRSAVLRTAAAEFLKRQAAEETDRRYRAGYADAAEGDCEPGDWPRELDGWAAQGVWPREREEPAARGAWSGE